ncbi:ABC transporter ATP-binding protein [Mesorhizobium sp. BR1-1-7]|uniref:ABC transporter ATP-binding protein n=1 Tax=Mesorhizobium sp. BR1-1-7 TaxID=2876647 RepID=UPI001CC99E10|nr:ABC transporter ATP-binding protein [Mesorhizobium sp. BR1-1-7]MBZ9921957.1 ABC transporter ATP-binding protein [Mesorhizobium sp. BR1-1-7]
MSDRGLAVGDARDAVLRTKNLRAYYQMSYFGIDREVRAVDSITMHVRRNEIYGLAGESSCGKTTFIKTIAAAIQPPLNVIGGSIRYSFLDRDIYALAPEQRDAIRWRHLSYIMQGSMSVLNPVRRVQRTFEDFAFRHMGLQKDAFLEAVKTHLARLRLSPDILQAYPHELSGGMRQRVCIALATVCRPDFIIADEPTTALDVVVQKDVLIMIRETQRQFGSSMIFVTHDLTVHANIADRLGIMYAGRLVEEGPTAAVFANPLHPYTAHLVASLPRIGNATARTALPGAPPNLAEPPAGCRFHPRCPLAMDICRREVPALTRLAPDHRVACFAASTEVRPDTADTEAAEEIAEEGA